MEYNISILVESTDKYPVELTDTVVTMLGYGPETNRRVMLYKYDEYEDFIFKKRKGIKVYYITMDVFKFFLHDAPAHARQRCTTVLRMITNREAIYRSKIQRAAACLDSIEKRPCIITTEDMLRNEGIDATKEHVTLLEKHLRDSYLTIKKRPPINRYRADRDEDVIQRAFALFRGMM